MAPDEAAVCADLASRRFRKGEFEGKWTLLGFRHPELFIAFAAAARPDSPPSFLMRLDVAGFRAIGPTGQFWNGLTDKALASEERPMSTAGGPMPYFSDFGPCLYHPIDRLAFAGGHWANDYLEDRWRPTDHLNRYLETVHDILHDPEYAGARLLDGAVALPARSVADLAA